MPKRFFAVVREGVADKPGKILCSFFLFYPLVFGTCLVARGSRDFICWIFFVSVSGFWYYAPPYVYTNSLLKTGLGL